MIRPTVGSPRNDFTVESMLRPLRADSMDFVIGDRLRSAAAVLAEATVALDYEQRPYLSSRYGESGRASYLRDIVHNVNYLSAAIDVRQPKLFTDYIAWAKTLLVSRGVSSEDVVEGLRCFSRALKQHPHHESFELAETYVAVALEQLPAMPAGVPSFLDPA